MNFSIKSKLDRLNSTRIIYQSLIKIHFINISQNLYLINQKQTIHGTYTFSIIQDKVSSFFGGLAGSVDIEITLDKKINQKVFKYRNKKG